MISALLCAAVHGQQVGTYKPENHPPFTIMSCTKSGGCQSEAKSLVLDANLRSTPAALGFQNCYTGGSWDASLCPDGVTCARNCALDGADYRGTYGVMVSGGDIRLNFVSRGSFFTNVGSRIFLLDSETEYKLFKLKNKEFTFDVDVVELPCGLNGALYMVEMEADGGMARYPGNKCGAKYGTGYCDARCPRDLKFINGEANCEQWTPSKTDKNSGTGRYGSCCNEMDIFEANRISTAYAPHVCTVQGQTRCEGADCGDDNATGQRNTGFCDKDGCDFNPYRLGDKTFYGPNPNFSVNSMHMRFTVVTQFLTADGTDHGELSEIRRLWIQGDPVIHRYKLIHSRNVTVGGKSFNSVTDDFCNAQKQEFGDSNDYGKRGGHKTMGGSLERGMVLVMGISDDHKTNMLWLDSDYPPHKPACAPGVARGTCSTSSGKPADVETLNSDASVTFSNIKYGELDSTYTI